MDSKITNKTVIKAELDDSGCVTAEVMGSGEKLFFMLGVIIQQIARSAAKNEKEIPSIIFFMSEKVMDYALKIKGDGTTIDLSEIIKKSQGGTTL